MIADSCRNIVNPQSRLVVVGDRVFVTTAVSEDAEQPRRFDGGVPRGARDATLDVCQWKVICLSVSTGEVLWDGTVHEGKPAHRRHRGNTYASKTPITADERVFVDFGPYGMTCYDHSGNRQSHDWDEKTEYGVMTTILRPCFPTESKVVFARPSAAPADSGNKSVFRHFAPHTHRSFARSDR
jgi:hypothetical protein